METSTNTAVANADVLDASKVDSKASGVTSASPGEQMINKVAKAVLLALALAVGLAAFAGSGIGEPTVVGADSEAIDGPRLGGDFAAFYAAGSIVWSGDIDSLYDPARQQAAQRDLGLDGYLAFAYPPHVAMAYAPLGAMSFQTAYLVHTGFMAAAFLLAVHVLTPLVPLLARWRWPLLAASFTFFPLITAIGGGQNAALSVLLLAAIWRSLHDGNEVAAGVAIGLLIFRPQYAIPLLGLVLLSKHWRAVGAAIATFAATWALTAAMRGADWLSSWWEQVGPFVDRDAEVNAANSISAYGFLQAAWSADSIAAQVLGMTIAVAVVAILMRMWMQPGRFTLAERMGAASIGIILISPHTMFYDASLLLVAGAALLAGSAAVPTRLLASAWVLALLHFVADALGATPLALLVMMAFVAWFWGATQTTGKQVQGHRSMERSVKEIA